MAKFILSQVVRSANKKWRHIVHTTRRCSSVVIIVDDMNPKTFPQCSSCRLLLPELFIFYFIEMLIVETKVI